MDERHDVITARLRLLNGYVRDLMQKQWRSSGIGRPAGDQTFGVSVSSRRLQYSKTPKVFCRNKGPFPKSSSDPALRSLQEVDAEAYDDSPRITHAR